MHKPGGGLTASALKTIAILAMVIDHIAWAFVPTYSALGIVMHVVGRITGPTMFFFLAEGYHHTRNANRYTLRLGIFALISYLPFYYFEFGTLPSATSFRPFGVIYTLFLGLLAIRARHEIRHRVLRVFIIIALLLLSNFGDWPVFGVLLPVLFDVYHGNFRGQAIAAGLVVLFNVLIEPFALLTMGYPSSWAVWSYSIIQAGQFLPLVLLWFYNGQRGRGGAFGKWFFYIIYPVHLLIIGLVRFEVLDYTRGSIF